MASPVPAAGKMLGRYQVLKPLAKGGMAEVFLARSVGLKGFERHVVLKFIRVEHGSDQKTIDMLLDEARLVASLHHRNIVQVHDVAEEDGKYFFAMEYVHGEDCRALLRKVKEAKAPIPLPHIITIVTAAAAGLHHAHEQRGPDRKPLGIVHRDISPGNILVGFDGGVKVVDFGIAKTNREENTQAGEMKGKVGYMSPEQCKALPLDRRTDVYMLGIVLYELCTVRRLFKGDNRFETMAQIVEGNIPPPSRYRKDLPHELEQIIMKALATDPAERYQTADDLRLVLEAFATRSNFQISPSKLSDYLKELFGERPEPWLVDAAPPEPHQVQDAVVVSSELRDGEPKRVSEPAIATPPQVAVTAEDRAALKSSVENDGGDTPMAWSMNATSPRGRRRNMMIAAIGGAIVVLGVMLVLATGGDDKARPAASTAQPPMPPPRTETPATDPAGTPAPPAQPAPPAPIDTPTASGPAPVDAGIEATATTPEDTGSSTPVAITPAPTPDRTPSGRRPGGRVGGRPKPDKPVDKPADKVTKPTPDDLDSPFPTD